MEGQEYLDQIASANRPTKKSNKILSSKFFWVIAIGLICFILIMIVGAVLSGNKTGAKNKTLGLILHIDNTGEIINEYQPKLKSSDLRMYSASLQSIYKDTSSKLTEYTDYDAKKVPNNITNEETTYKDSLSNELFSAKINGILDRIFAHKMAYEISLVMNEESAIYKASNDEDLKTIIETSYNSLDTLYSEFNDFSETK